MNLSFVILAIAASLAGVHCMNMLHSVWPDTLHDIAEFVCKSLMTLLFFSVLTLAH